MSFQYKLCRKQLANNDHRRRRHIRSHDIQGKSYKCHNCGESFQEKRYLDHHLKLQHDPNHFKQFECLFCRKRFGGKDHLERHLLHHIKEKHLFCKLCNQESFSKLDLKRHIKTHDSHRERKFQCELCPKKFLKNFQLVAHIGSHLNERAFKCGQCNKTFKTRACAKQHTKLVHIRDRSFKCSSCDKAYLKKYDLQMHENTHKGHKPHHCKCRGKWFTRKTDLHKHVKRHNINGELANCELCDVQFKSSLSLAEHKRRVHVKKHECIFCNKRYHLKERFEGHIRRHTQEHPYWCTSCRKESRTSRDLKKHMQIHDVTRERKFKCQLCSQAFLSKGGLQIHVGSHTGEAAHKCKFAVCKMRFKSKQGLKLHQAKHSNK